MKRILLRVLAKGVLVVFIAFFISLTNNSFLQNAQAAGDKELVIQCWGGVILEADQKAFFESFTKETGIKIVPVLATGNLWGKVGAQVMSKNVEWDLVSGAGYHSMKSAMDKGLLEEIDYSIVTNTKDLIPGSVKPWGLGQEINVYCVGYNSKKFAVDNQPKSLVDFYDAKKFPAPRSINNWGGMGTSANLISALLADGVPPDKVIPIDYNRAFKKLDQIKPHIKLFFKTGDQFMQALLEEEVTLAFALDGRYQLTRRSGVPFKIVWDQGLSFIAYWGVVKNAPNKKAAMQFINHVCRPELQAIWTRLTGYSCTNPNSVKYLPPELQTDQAVSPENRVKQLDIFEKNTVWLAEHMDEMIEKWNEWLAKK